MGYEITKDEARKDKIGIPELLDQIEFAWAIIANVSLGDWHNQSATWQDAAARFRTEYHNIIRITLK